ncbi:hypothetical protein B5M09_012372 [Aphanomyces astaci]|uniref:Uncharacterized protein n=1 Tax=Aphanomyces astaci TaxID=112090 RepID=A0A425DGG0_APHAT|nr:hypothetical protein B5M09_012372 [Aphanomyces astaci]
MKLYQSLLVGATAVYALRTFSAKVLVDTKTSQCELIESVHLTQLHRAIQSTTDTLGLDTLVVLGGPYGHMHPKV